MRSINSWAMRLPSRIRALIVGGSPAKRLIIPARPHAHKRNRMADTSPSTAATELDAQGVRLRPWWPEDADALYEAARESIASVSPWLPWLHEGYGRSDSVRWIAEAEVARRRGDAHVFGIFDAQ